MTSPAAIAIIIRIRLISTLPCAALATVVLSALGRPDHLDAASAVSRRGDNLQGLARGLVAGGEHVGGGLLLVEGDHGIGLGRDLVDQCAAVGLVVADPGHGALDLGARIERCEIRSLGGGGGLAGDDGRGTILRRHRVAVLGDLNGGLLALLLGLAAGGERDGGDSRGDEDETHFGNPKKKPREGLTLARLRQVGNQSPSPRRTASASDASRGSSRRRGDRRRSRSAAPRWWLRRRPSVRRWCPPCPSWRLP